MKKIFHGDDYKTEFLSPSLMNNGNNEVGVGISFSMVYETSLTYGADVISCEIDEDNFVPARSPIGNVLEQNEIFSILKDLYNFNREFVYYEITNWVGYEIDIYDILDDDLEQLAFCYRNEEVRNFQISMADAFGVENFVAAWNKHTDIDGTYLVRNKEDTWYAIINPSIPVEKLAQIAA